MRLYCTDAYASYDEAPPLGRPDVGKEETGTNERNNARLRHWLARFRRWTVVASQSAALVDRAMNLFAHFHCPGATSGPALVR